MKKIGWQNHDWRKQKYSSKVIPGFFFPGTRNRIAYFRFGALPHGAKGVCHQFRYRGLGIFSKHHSRRGLPLASRDLEVHDGSRSGVRDSQLFYKMVLSTTDLYFLKIITVCPENLTTTRLLYNVLNCVLNRSIPN